MTSFGSSPASFALPDLEAVEAELRRRDLLEFVRASVPGYEAGWVHHEVCARLEAFSRAVAAGQSPRLMLLMPPRHGKSLLSSERLPAWHLGHHGDHNIVVASYGQDLSNRFSLRCRDVCREPWFEATFPDFAFHRDRQLIQSWETAQGGGYRAVGIGGALTGMGAHLLILDDIIRDYEQADSAAYRDKAWDWYQAVAYTRLMPGAGVLVLNTRWHDDDLAGRLLDAQADEGEQWEVIRFPAVAEDDEEHRKAGEPLHPERYPLAKLQAIRRTIGAYKWSALYQQRPTPQGGGIFRKDWLRHHEGAGGRFDLVAISVDATFKETLYGSFVVLQVWGRRGSKAHLLDQRRGRWSFTRTLTEIERLRRDWPAASAIYIEDKANGPAILDTLRQHTSGVIPVSPRGSKQARAHATAPLFEAGDVLLPPEGTPWLGDYLAELLNFPAAKSDDQVDATTQALSKLLLERRSAFDDSYLR